MEAKQNSQEPEYEMSSLPQDGTQSNSQVSDIPLTTRDSTEQQFHAYRRYYDSNESTEDEAKENGAEEIDEYTQVIPHNNLLLVVPGLLLSIFLSALDATIVTTAMPTIVKELNGQSSYSWIGTAYTLAETAILPFCGALSDIVGRRLLLFSSIVLFLFGSAMCGAAQNMIWLIVCRAVQGVGGGGIMSLVTIVIADITSLESRAYYAGMVGATWGIASVLGPLLGGAISQSTTWRWIFFINLPTGGVSLVLLVSFLHTLPIPKTPFNKFLHTFDFVGIVTVTAGVVLFLLGLTIGATTNKWRRANVLSYIIIGVICIVLCAINEARTRRIPIIPPKLFVSLSTTAILLTAFVHYYIMANVSYYIPVYFQTIKGDGPLMSGVHTLSLAAVTSAVSAISGFVIGKLRNYKYPMIFGWVLLLSGAGSMLAIRYNTSIPSILGFLALIGAGIGNLFQPNLIAIQASVPPKFVATASSAFMLVRNMGSSIGISLGDVIYEQSISTNLAGTGISKDLNYAQIQAISDSSQRIFVLKAYANAMRMIWIVNLPLAIIGLLGCFFVKQIRLHSRVVMQEKQES
ncbi:membrane transporter [Schizosaccharomyces japonicus yFS275]|uniref:Membrane transporter n=1 Tax=Schizosaccharomyces japonicus (strain yFS275 / FY16936) TaxID=402676 RepID=B6K7K1_SCHJY|nr:membrane transporter [Schizosaccharomyces japonicus yFS275]EEB09505.1 membrane transporter [Schizosaccharomyces japonicus yFS275]